MRASHTPIDYVRVGAILYTSYLQVLGALHRPSSESVKRVYPPPPASNTLVAGFMAGSIQSVIAAPLDALQVRFHTSDVLQGKYKNMWQYGRRKLQEIGIRAAFAGWRLSLLKESMGYAAFFATFEYVKAQGYYAYVTWYYGGLSPFSGSVQQATNTIKPHYAIEPTFLMLAGLSASIAQQVIQHPLTLIQQIHHTSLLSQKRAGNPRLETRRSTYGAYGRTYRRCLVYARRFGGWRRWLYRGFFLTSLRQVPSTSAGLVVFELVRRRYGTESQAVKIQKDNYSILLA